VKSEQQNSRYEAQHGYHSLSKHLTGLSPREGTYRHPEENSDTAKAH
ncbi:uncharacterized protein METZ01_LOCUS232667, partial [marine metagenome]